MSEWCVCHFHHFHAQVPPRGAASDDQPESRVTAGRWGDVAAAGGGAGGLQLGAPGSIPCRPWSPRHLALVPSQGSSPVKAHGTRSASPAAPGARPLSRLMGPGLSPPPHLVLVPCQGPETRSESPAAPGARPLSRP